VSFKRPGFTCISNEIARYKNISPSAFRLYGFLSTFNPCFTSYDRIEEGTGLSRATIKKSINELMKLGLVEYDRGNSKKKANLYKLYNKIAITSSNSEPVASNQFKNYTSTSSKNELQPVQILNSNKTNVIIPIKKGDLQKMVKSLTAKKSLE